MSGDRVMIHRPTAGVVTISIDREERLNAMDDVTMVELARALAEADADPEVAVVVLASSGTRWFSAGADLKALAQRMPSGEDDDWYALAPFMNGGYAKPVVVAMAGDALGGGFELVLACDVVVAGRGAKLALPEVRRGLLASIGAVSLPVRVPMGLALEMALTGEPITAETALSHGLVNRVVEPDEVLATAEALAAAIARNAPVSLQHTKRLVVEAAEGRVTEARELAAELRDHIATTHDALEGARAFGERREPQWTGR